jgi:hypothetical protein
MRTRLTDGDHEEHRGAIDRSESGNGVAAKRVCVEMGHDFVLPFFFRPACPVDAKGNAGGVPISFIGG